MINTIILGHALDVLPQLPAESVSCVTTSPPFWGLRDYGVEPIIWDGDKDCKHNFDNINRLHPTRGNRGQGIDKKYPIRESQQPTEIDSNFCTKCNAWRGSLGLEPTFELYIKHLCDIFDQVKRVLRKDGTCWVNMGDTYWGGGQGGNDYGGKFVIPSTTFGHIAKGNGYQAKSLTLIPQRFAIEMVNRGWILRNTIIWHKPNCMPSSAKDRFTVDFEYVYFFVKSRKYWFEQQFDPQKECSIKRAFSINHLDIRKDRENKEYAISSEAQNETYKRMREKIKSGEVPKRNKRTVWTIPTQPFPEAHFAVYPECLIEIPIKAGCPEFVCKKCGKARVKIYKHEKMNIRSHKLSKGKVKDAVDGKNKDYNVGGGFSRTGVQFEWNHIPVGYSDCGCNAGFESGIVLDQFMGAGTTALVALKQRKRFIGIEIKQEYIDMSYKRIARVQQRIF